MLEEFIWSPRVGASSDTQADVLASQYGNGYSQRLSVGINNLSSSYPVSFTGTEQYLKPILEFFQRHKGATSFLWTPPMQDQGRFVTTGGWQTTSHGRKRFTLSTNFQQVFSP
ncbi:phage tail protein [Pseudomonas sp. 148P]|uniref:Phage tail protein n=1 Tax=Pseudomonas ulcerans TaxID=3115852 RepID=A0ABU7HQA9_9PSED|nr:MULTISPECIES: phage tail protein [unclassified Pseudomonas]MEE1922686.1 phage tail protein [Pseudomonas sp. 147P]MEE1933663.1 phage tail protein [Pseudomonas sp. 148P]